MPRFLSSASRSVARAAVRLEVDLCRGLFRVDAQLLSGEGEVEVATLGGEIAQPALDGLVFCVVERCALGQRQPGEQPRQLGVLGHLAVDHDRALADGHPRAERDREAQEYRSTGKELAEGIRADADRQERIIRAEAYRDAEKIRGEGDALATATYAAAFNKDAEFYKFHRSLEAYRSAFDSKDDVLVLKPDSEFFKYLNKTR